MRSKTIPVDAEQIRTYDGLRGFREAFFNADFYLLLLVGRPGLSKSYEFEAACQPHRSSDGTTLATAHYVKGNITPVEAYRVAFEHRNKLLVFDDAERLWSDNTGRYLLRDLTECKLRKQVNWRTDNKSFEKQGIPKSFVTNSRVCLIMNHFAFGNAHEYEAVMDRAHFIYFDPTPLEIHKNTALWFWDQEIYDFVGQHLHLLAPDKLSSRSYIKAYERKAIGDWQEFLVSRYFAQSGEQWVRALENDPNYHSTEARVTEFVRRTGLGRSTYFELKKKLGANGQLSRVEVPRISLTARPPEQLEWTSEATNDAERERRRAEQDQIERQEEQEYRDLEDKYFGGDDEDDEP